jgi:hypothetical protein
VAQQLAKEITIIKFIITTIITTTIDGPLADTITIIIADIRTKFIKVLNNLSNSTSSIISSRVFSVEGCAFSP